MKKTISQWYQDLDEPYRGEALENMKNDPLGDSGDVPAESLAHAITSGMVWGKTPQGHEYWERLFWRVCDEQV